MLNLNPLNFSPMYISSKTNSLEDSGAADTIEDDQSSAVPFKSSVYQPLKISLRFHLKWKFCQWALIILEASYRLTDIYYVNEVSVVRNKSVCIKKFSALIMAENKNILCMNVAAFWVVFYRKSCGWDDIQIRLARCAISQSLASVGKARKARCAFLYTVNYSTAAFLLLSTVFLCFA